MISGVNERRLLTEKEVEVEYGMSVPWLRRHRLFGTGPVYRKIGRQVRYLREDIEKYLDHCAVVPKTS